MHIPSCKSSVYSELLVVVLEPGISLSKFIHPREGFCYANLKVFGGKAIRYISSSVSCMMYLVGKWVLRQSK